MSNENVLQGELSKLVCRVCRAEVKRYVSCMKCDKIFHASCGLKIIGLCVQREGIICCTAINDSDGRTLLSPSSATSIGGFVSPLEYELIKKLLEEVQDKNLILKANNELLEDKIKMLQDKIENLNGENIRRCDKVSYASTVRNRNNECVLIKPRNNQNYADTLSEIKKSIKPSEIAAMGLEMGRIKNIGSGGVAIECKNEAAKTQIKKKIMDTMGDGYAIKEGVALSPRIVVKYVEEEVMNESDNVIIELLIKQNCLECESNEIKILKRYKSGKNKVIGNIVLELHSEVFSKLIGLKKVNLGYRLCTLQEYFNIIRCYKCVKYGHMAANCKNNIRCGRCAEMHNTIDCTSTIKRCANCVEANDNLNLRLDTGHTVFDIECKCLKRIEDGIKKKTNYNFL